MPAKILVVDDRPLMRDAVRSFLIQQSRWEIYEAENCKLALSRMPEIKPDVVVLDIPQLEMNELQVADEISRLAPETKIIFMSNHYTPEVVSFMSGLLGAGEFIQTTEIATRLVPTIRRLLPAGNQAHG